MNAADEFANAARSSGLSRRLEEEQGESAAGIAEVMGMGVKEEIAIAALEMSGGDPQTAISMITQGCDTRCSFAHTYTRSRSLQLAVVNFTSKLTYVLTTCRSQFGSMRDCME
eukprot:SAG11_NODE_8915_length_963_cov_1.010417_1_plen_113_part_00